MEKSILIKDKSNPSFPEPFKIRHAIVAIELGKTDETTFKYLRFLTNQIPFENASFLHVIPDFSLLASLYEKSEDSPFNKFHLKAQLAEDLSEKINNYLTKIIDATTYAILEGNPLEQLLNSSKTTKADLVVIGQDSEKKHHSILAKNLARKVKGNALVIPDTASLKLDRILVAIDFSDHSKKALETAVRINRRLDNKATIIALHVYEMPNYDQFKINRSWTDYNHIISQHKHDAFNKFMSDFNPEDRSFIETQLVVKDLPGTARYILEAIDSTKTDLIIMGAKGHSKVELLLMGSVTERLLTLNKKVPTLIVK